MQNKIRSVCRKLGPLVQSRGTPELDNVVGVGEGYRQVGGKRTPEWCVVVYVRKKKRGAELSPTEAIPQYVDGVRTDVQEVGGEFEPLVLERNQIRATPYERGEVAQELVERWRPCPGGYSIGHQLITAGTLGCYMDHVGIPHVLSNNHVLAACFDDKTQILTGDGFKFFSELTGDEEVATRSPGGALQFQKPTKVHSYDYDGPLLHFTGRSIDQMVTPNHRMFAKRVYKSGMPPHMEPNSLDFHHADCILAEMSNKRSVSYEFDDRATWHCTAPSTIQIPRVEYSKGRDWNIGSMPIDSWLELFGKWMADGSATLNSANGQRSVLIRETDPTIRKRVCELATDCGFQPWDCSTGSVVINSKQLYEYLEQFGKSGDKFIPKQVKDLPPTKLHVFLKGYLEADGYSKRDQWTATTKSKRLADGLQELFLKCGQSSKVRSFVQQSGYNPGATYYEVATRSRPCLRLQKPPSLVHYKGKVYCVTVPNGVIMTRRNGLLAWSGNSNEASPGDWIFQPGPLDGGTGLSNRFGSLVQFARINFRSDSRPPKKRAALTAWKAWMWPANTLSRLLGCHNRLTVRDASKTYAVEQPTPNLIDAAISNVIEEWVDLDIHQIGQLQGIRDPQPGQRVRKSGRTTEHTHGTVTGLNAAVTVNYGTGKGNADFADQMIIEADQGEFSAGGDSGSAIVDQDNFLVGLLFAGSPGRTIACKATHVARLLNLTIL